MYLIKATDDFIEAMSNLPLCTMHQITSSFLSVKKIESELFVDDKSSFIDDLLEQIRNQEKE